ncbi:hypothetical protein V3F56_08740 [Moorellaceae bacterium AZ2]
MVQDDKGYPPVEDEKASQGQRNTARGVGGKQLRGGIPVPGKAGREPREEGDHPLWPRSFPQGRIGSAVMITPGGQPPLEENGGGEG